MQKLRRQLTNSSIKSVALENIDSYTVIEVKNHLLKLAKENEDVFDEGDVKKYVNDTRQLRRFIQRKGDVHESIRYVSNILNWRTEMGINKINLNMFPKELFTCGIFFFIEDNHTGSCCLVIRGNFFVKGKIMNELINTFTACLCYHLNDKLVEKGEKSMNIIFDARGIGLSNCDFDSISFMLDLLANKMPNMISKIIFYDMSWYILPFLKTCMLFLPEHWREVMLHANSKSIKKYISRDMMPTFFPASIRDKPIGPIETIENKRLLKDFTDEDLKLIGMKKANLDEYYKLLKHFEAMSKK